MGPELISLYMQSSTRRIDIALESANESGRITAPEHIGDRHPRKRTGLDSRGEGR